MGFIKNSEVRGPIFEDIGSGSVAVLELARLVHEAKVQLDYTIMFVMFDFEEYGSIGSYYFVDEWLIPKELRNTNTQFLGLYNLDMVLSYNATPGSKVIHEHFANVRTLSWILCDINKNISLFQMCPEETQKMKDNGFRGDFIAAITRRGVDEELSRKIFAEWPKTDGSNKYKLRKFDVLITYITGNSNHKLF